MKNIKEKIVYFNSLGESGNIYYILGMARRELMRRNEKSEWQELEKRIRMSDEYAESINVIREYVELVDLDGRI